MPVLLLHARCLGVDWAKPAWFGRVMGRKRRGQIGLQSSIANRLHVCNHSITILGKNCGAPMTTMKDGDMASREHRGSKIEPFEKFDVADYLDSPEIVAVYLSESFAEADSALIAEALRTAARANGMAEVASRAGLARESLYKALRPGSQPRLETILKVIGALGFKLVVQPVPDGDKLKEENDHVDSVSSD